jgi:hypothetical protein
MPIQFKICPTTGCVENTYSGFLSREDYQALFAFTDAAVDKLGRVNMIDIVESYAGFDDAILDEISEENFYSCRGINRLAIVSDIGWSCPVLANAPADISIESRSFTLSELDKARKWVCAKPLWRIQDVPVHLPVYDRL